MRKKRQNQPRNKKGVDWWWVCDLRAPPFALAEGPEVVRLGDKRHGKRSSQLIW